MKSFISLTGVAIITAMPIFAAAGRASDGHLFFLALLGFLGVILGILYLADLVRYIFYHTFGKNGSNYQL